MGLFIRRQDSTLWEIGVCIGVGSRIEGVCVDFDKEIVKVGDKGYLISRRLCRE